MIEGMQREVGQRKLEGRREGGRDGDGQKEGRRMGGGAGEGAQYWIFITKRFQPLQQHVFTAD